MFIKYCVSGSSVSTDHRRDVIVDTIIKLNRFFKNIIINALCTLKLGILNVGNYYDNQAFQTSGVRCVARVQTTRLCIHTFVAGVE